MIDFALAGDNRFAKTEVGVENKASKVSGHRIDGKAHAGAFAWNLPLHHDGHTRLLLHEPELVTLEHGTVLPQRQNTIAYALGPGVCATNVQVRVVLPGEGRLRQVLERRRRAHG